MQHHDYGHRCSQDICLKKVEPLMHRSLLHVFPHGVLIIAGSSGVLAAEAPTVDSDSPHSVTGLKPGTDPADIFGNKRFGLCDKNEAKGSDANAHAELALKYGGSELRPKNVVDKAKAMSNRGM